MSAFYRARASRPLSSLCVLGVAVVSGLLAGCAQGPGQQNQRTRSSEYFPASKYGPASARVVTEGQAVPRGGGQRLVGRPYTIAGKRYVPREVRPGFTFTGTASWYGAAFHGRRTANGEVYDMRALSAAHPTMPLPSYARVTNLTNGHSIIVRVNDRGPFHAGRVLDVSQRVAETLDFRRSGTGRVKVDYIGPAGLAGSDDARLIASLRTDGRPAMLDGPTSAPATMIAQSAPAQSTPASAPAARMAQRSPDPSPQSVASISQSRGASASSGATVVAASSQLPPARPAAPGQPIALASQPTGQAARNVALPQVAFAPTSVANAGAPAYAPLPPPRPFDLMTIPGADTPIAAPRRRTQPTFFAEPSPVAATLIQRRPFDGVDLNGLQPLR